MHELYKLKEMLCDELKEYGGKGEMSSGTLDVVDKLAHSIKNLDKIIEAYEDADGYSPRPYDGMYYRGSYNDGMRRGSYARGRTGNVRRDSMGRYSRDSGLSEELRELMQDAPNDQIRAEMQRLVDKVDRM